MPLRGAGRATEVSVPGKIMLAGEYAVLKGGRSLSSAVDAFLTLTIEPSEHVGVWVESNLWPEPRLLTPQPQTEPLLDALQRLLSHNVRVSVTSDLDVSYGLGSSSAIRLAAHLATHAFEQNTINLSFDERWTAAREAWHAQKTQQGFASGYDLVTQLQGGYVHWSPDYEQWPGRVQSRDPDWLKEYVHPYIGGEGAPTGKVGGGVRTYLDAGNLWPELLARSEALVTAFAAESLDAVISANQQHRALFVPAPFYPQKIYKLLASLPDFDRSWSFKTTGAGGEDAILLLGPKSCLTEADQTLKQRGWKPLPHTFTALGTRITWKDLGP
ncbi:MAG: hypothetical protein EOP10_19000 [Proteobacteria bacterium]|nr:MAG: hypothetical protein EOP10_19000 [Pseudomonadota bacterium]